MAEKKQGCVAPATGPVTQETPETAPAASPDREVPAMIARVGQEAPDFGANAYIPEKKDFAPVKLSDYKGKWITLCFYPGDFTFV